MRLALVVAFLLAAFLIPAASASHAGCTPAECMPIQPIVETPYGGPGIRFDSFSADVRALHDLVETRLRMVFTNPSPTASDVTLAFPLPPGATLLGFNLTTDSRVLEGTVQEKGAARVVYQEAKAQGRDAVLLEAVDRNHVELSVNIPAGAQRTLAARYLEWADSSSGVRIYRLPLHLLPADVGEVSLAARIEDAGLRVPGATGVDLPFTTASTTGDVATAARTLAAPGALRDVVMSWQVPTGLHAALFASSPSGAGAGVANLCLATGTVLPRDVVFVLDRSGSMAGTKIAHARESLRDVLPTLGTGDRYNVVLFDNTVERLHEGLVAGLPSTIAADVKHLAPVFERGSTDLDAALQDALTQLGAAGSPGSSGRIPMIVLLSDGLPTMGEVDHHTIIERFVSANGRHARVHVVPIGLDADETFLADLALQSGGTFTPLDPDQGNLRLHLDRLYDRIGHPLADDLQITVTGVTATDTLPGHLPVLNEDGCLQMAFWADWSGSTDVVVHVTGHQVGAALDRSFTFRRAEIPVVAGVQSLWGRMQVEELLSRERTDEVDLRTAVVQAAVTTRQLTPYTSWIIAEPMAAAAQPPISDGIADATAIATGAYAGPPPATPPSAGTGSAGSVTIGAGQHNVALPGSYLGGGTGGYGGSAMALPVSLTATGMASMTATGTVAAPALAYDDLQLRWNSAGHANSVASDSDYFEAAGASQADHARSPPVLELGVLGLAVVGGILLRRRIA